MAARHGVEAVKLAPHKPIREQYRPTPSAAERRHHIRVMQLACLGCGREPCGVAHHVLQDTPSKRWKRDHRVVIGICDPCHRALHMAGSEHAWRPDLDCASEAESQLLASINEGIL